MRLLHTMIRVNDIDESLRFYCDALGMKLLRKKDYPSGRFTPPSSVTTGKSRRR